MLTARPTTKIYTLSLHDALPIYRHERDVDGRHPQVGRKHIELGERVRHDHVFDRYSLDQDRSEEHTSELQSHSDLVCRLLLEKKNMGSDGNYYAGDTGWHSDDWH